MGQQRKNIFLDESIWDRPWFDALHLEYQTAYMLLWSESDNVGVWEPHTRKLCYRLKKEEFELNDFFEKVNDKEPKIIKLENGDWWLLEYLPRQVKTLTPNNRPHVSYIEGLISHNLLARYARENPDSVNYEKVYKLEGWKDINDSKAKERARDMFTYLKKRQLVRPLKEACKTLGRGCQDSKDKEKDKVQGRGGDGATSIHSLPNIEEGEDFSDVSLVETSEGSNV